MVINESFESGLLKILVRMKMMTQEDAHAIEKSFHDSEVDRFDEFLLQENIVDEANLLQALSEYYQVPSFDVLGYFFETRYVRMFPKDMLLRYSLIPLEVDENIMLMITSNPADPELLFEIGEHVSYDIQFYVGIGRDIGDSVKEFYDKADTEYFLGEEDEEGHLSGELYISRDGEGEESLTFSLDDEDSFE
jgi:type IV pilus assembly protein PilB